jgi:tRNA-dihydrouridine synthase B
VDQGAQIVDINMGCPAKKVCNAAAGSALLANEKLVAEILEAVVAAVVVPVTLKIRTGPNPQWRNAVAIARMAEAAGVAALTVHGRTRACAFVGAVEYDTIAAVKRAVSIPVIANGDIATPEHAGAVLLHTGADAVMIGRAAQGRPWIFREIAHYLATGAHLPPPTVAEARALIVAHLADHYDFYGEVAGVRIARKHLGWYTESLAGGPQLRGEANAAGTASEQLAAVERFFDRQRSLGERLSYFDNENVAGKRADVHALSTSISQQTTNNANRAGEALAA